MKEIESLSVRYVGFKNPENKDEVEMECLGLRTALAAINQRIAVLEQSLKLQKMVDAAQIGTIQKETTDEKTVAETPPTEKSK